MWNNSSLVQIKNSQVTAQTTTRIMSAIVPSGMEPTAGPGNPRLEEGMRKFLRFIPPDDLFLIVKTTTGGLISASNIEEAISVIIRYSDPVSVLYRRRIKIEYLVNFLHSENVPIRLPSSKVTLCNSLLRHWDWKAQGQEPDTTSPKTQPNVYGQQQGQSSNPQIHWESAGPSHRNSFTSGSSFVNGAQNIVVMNQPTSTSLVPNSNYPNYEQQIREELGVSFTTWFYTMLNTLNDFEPKHFWSTCSLRVEAVSHQQTPVVKEAINDGPACCALLRVLVEEERICFNPNLENGLGVNCVMDSYGLVQVKVAGTVQVLKPGLSIPGGVFEQLFGIMKDMTAENNFKVKFSVLRLRAAVNELEYVQLSNAIKSTPVVIEEISD